MSTVSKHMLMLPLLLLLFSPLFLVHPVHASETVHSRQLKFIDVTHRVGLTLTLPVRSCCRVAVGDYNRDGYMDILVDGCRLFRNNGPPDYTFTDVTEEAGLSHLIGLTDAGFFGDFNNDGWLDIVAVGADNLDPLKRRDYLLMNNGDGTFTDVTVECGNICDEYATKGAAWGDFDNDGWLDLYMVNFEMGEGEPPEFGCPDKLYRNVNGVFQEVTASAGIIDENLRGHSACWGDFDNDGDLDIYVANYRLQRNYLWRNNGDGTFTDVAEQLGVEGIDPPYYGHSFSAAWGDLNNDGYLDLVVMNLAHKDPIRGAACEDSYIFINNGPPDFTFTNIRNQSGIPVHEIGSVKDRFYYDELFSAVTLADFDNDGYLDMFITQVKSYVPFAYSFLYLNNGNLTFRDVTEDAGVRIWDAASCAWIDFNNDGFLDIITGGRSEFGGEGGLHLFMNLGNGNHWLRVRLVGKQSNSYGVGARIKIVIGDQIQIRDIDISSGLPGQNPPEAHFGLGDYDRIDLLEIRWPSGVVQRFRNIEADKILTIDEEQGILDEEAPTVKIVQPQNGSTVQGTVEVVVNATDNIQVAEVKFFIDDQLAYIDDLAPFTWTWDSRQVENGYHRISVTAIDYGNNTATDSITVYVDNPPPDTKPPTIIHTPIEHHEKGKPLTITVQVTDNVEVDTVILNYRVGKTGNWTSVVMERVNETFYSYTIPETEIMDSIIEYYIVANDSLGNVAMLPPEGSSSPFTVKIESKEAASTPYTLLLGIFVAILIVGVAIKVLKR